MADPRSPTDPPRAGAAARHQSEPPRALALVVGRRRAQILIALKTARTSGEVAAAAGIASSTASEHLHELALAGVVDRRRAGRFVYYTLSETGRHLVDELSAPRPRH
jgi:DNA-binding transcriptional ArsR family regulator